MTQMPLDLTPPTPQPKRRRVPKTSVAVAQELGASGYLDYREREVLAMLRKWDAYSDQPGTSAEVAALRSGMPAPSTDCKLFIRRGLSSLLAKGAVAHGGERVCAVTKRRCVTWRVVSR